MTLYKYSGAGNDFVVLDGREIDAGSFREEASIRALCDRRTGFVAADGRTGADGLMILGESADVDFRMEYYNSDGSSGMMCGNGGRCIVAFAHFLGIEPGGGDGRYLFEAPDGMHFASLEGECGDTLTVSLKMVDVNDMIRYDDGCFLNTGTRHFVTFRKDVEAVDISHEGAALRHDPRFAPEGANVNFVSAVNGGIKVRTFEKGVEDETLACGTGITASAIAAYYNGIDPSGRNGNELTYRVQARQDMLQVRFTPADIACEVYLIGPATLIR